MSATSSRFDSQEEAQSFINAHTNATGYYILGLYNSDDRTVLAVDGLYDDGVRRGMLDDFIREHFPIESDLMRQQREAREAVRLVIVSYLVKFGIILLTVGVAMGINLWLGKQDPVVCSCLALLFFGGGTLGYLIDWKIKTWGGRTFAEKLSERALIACYVIGTAVSVLSLDLIEFLRNSF
ncbi:hypothetical protein [Spirosoma rigui]|uniref:hypothetical protein n=1 Tax=Spirosoma rigui TaxID=564064 RepID=UPI0009B10999|nr:hypothetical protein [Spirosoma rigui]